ncbi:hypothetical protein, partial [Vibrio sp. V03_P4A6T147]|uniref:hypothetical protein n=1 Tax=Vibrio sp. V03_P4A6T147 TaxID=1938658 RepID=UPI00384F6000
SAPTPSAITRNYVLFLHASELKSHLIIDPMKIHLFSDYLLIRKALIPLDHCSCGEGSLRTHDHHVSLDHASWYPDEKDKFPLPCRSSYYYSCAAII